MGDRGPDRPNGAYHTFTGVKGEQWLADLIGMTL